MVIVVHKYGPLKTADSDARRGAGGASLAAAVAAISGQAMQIGIHRAELVVGIRLADVFPRHRGIVDVAAVGILASAEEFHKGIFLPGGHDDAQIWTDGWPEAAWRAAAQVGSMTHGAAGGVDQILAIGRRARRRSNL